MTVVGLDFGASCGWAVESEGKLSSGTWRLDPGKRSCDANKEVAFIRHLEQIREFHGVPELVAYEEVVAHGRPDTKRVECPECHTEHDVRVQAMNAIASHAYGGYLGLLRYWSGLYGVRLESVPVPTLKLFATGNGRASKDDMVAYAKLQWRDQDITTHDQADALHVLDWALREVLRRRHGKVKVDRGGQLQLAPPQPPAAPEVEF